MRWRCGAAVAAHRWKGVAKGNWFRISLRRQMIPNSERNRAPSAFTGPRVSKAMVTNTWVAGRVRPKPCFGYGFGAETAKYLGFGLVSVTAVTRILVSAWFQLRP